MSDEVATHGAADAEGPDAKLAAAKAGLAGRPTRSLTSRPHARRGPSYAKVTMRRFKRPWSAIMWTGTVGATLALVGCGGSDIIEVDEILTNTAPTITLDSVEETEKGVLTARISTTDPDVDPRLALKELRVDLSGPVVLSRTLDLRGGGTSVTTEVQFADLPRGQYAVRASVQDVAGASAEGTGSAVVRAIDIRFSARVYRLSASGSFDPLSGAVLIIGRDTVPIDDGRADIAQLRSPATRQAVTVAGEHILPGYLVCARAGHDGIEPNIINATAFNAAPMLDTALVEGLNERLCTVIDDRVPVDEFIADMLLGEKRTHKWAHLGDTLLVQINTVATGHLHGEAAHRDALYAQAKSAISEVMEYFARMPGRQHTHSVVLTRDGSDIEELSRDGSVSIVPTDGQMAGGYVGVDPNTYRVRASVVYVWNVEPDLNMDLFHARQMIWRHLGGWGGFRKSTDKQGILWGPVGPDRYQNPGEDPLDSDWAALGFFRLFDGGTEFAPPTTTEAAGLARTATRSGGG